MKTLTTSLLTILRVSQLPIPEPTLEYRFHPKRQWRFDAAWPSHKLAVEMDGGVFIKGRHSGGMNQVKDNHKLNAAAERGWRVLRFTIKDVESRPFEIAEQIHRCLTTRFY